MKHHIPCLRVFLFPVGGSTITSKQCERNNHFIRLQFTYINMYSICTCTYDILCNHCENNEKTVSVCLRNQARVIVFIAE